MKYIFLFLLGVVNQTEICGQDQASIKYSLDRRLTWDDFSGEPDHMDSTKAAQISTTIKLQSSKVNFWTGKVEFTGSAIMYKHKSWVKEEFKNEYVLAHEQIHFDIAFIIAKKMEADINSLNVNIMNKGLIDAVYKNWHSIFILNEETYDLMTDGGNDLQMQKYWHQKMEGALNITSHEFLDKKVIR